MKFAGTIYVDVEADSWKDSVDLLRLIADSIKDKFSDNVCYATYADSQEEEE